LVKVCANLFKVASEMLLLLVPRGSIKLLAKSPPGGAVIETEVTSGFRDSFGNIEILNGATEGDQIVIFEG